MGERKKTPEKVVQDAVIEHLRISGWLVQRNQQAMGNTKGRPDLEAVKKFKGLGVTIYVECKAPRGRLSERQLEYIRGLRAEGALVSVCKSIEEFINDLALIEYKIRERMAWLR